MNIPKKFSTGVCSSAAPMFLTGMRQKISAKISSVPTNGSAFLQCKLSFLTRKGLA